jgi:rubredoxin
VTCDTLKVRPTVPLKVARPPRTRARFRTEASHLHRIERVWAASVGDASSAREAYALSNDWPRTAPQIGDRRGEAKSFHVKRNIQMSEQPYKSWRCRTCGFIYEEESGAPEEGLAPGTRWAEIPDDWVCPLCGTAKSDFDMVEI